VWNLRHKQPRQRIVCPDQDAAEDHIKGSLRARRKPDHRLIVRLALAPLPPAPLSLIDASHCLADLGLRQPGEFADRPDPQSRLAPILPRRRGFILSRHGRETDAIGAFCAKDELALR
jgi:hypothetical protein